MSKRQRRNREKRRRQQTQRPRRAQVAAGAGLALGATLGITGTAHATDFTVTNLNSSGDGSLTAAVEAADNNPGADRVLFQSGLTGTINLTIELYVTDPVDIVGPGADKVTVSSTEAVAVVYPGDGQSASISGLTLTGHNGNNGGIVSTGIDGSSNNLTISNSVLTGGSSTGDGGAIYVSAGSLQVENTTISGNTADNAGGAIYFGDTDAPSAIRNSTISGNAVTNQGGGYDDAGGIYIDNDQPMSPILIENSTIAGNTAPDRGGAIYDFSHPAGVLTIESSTIDHNSSGNRFGGIYTYFGPTIRNTIIANSTDSHGNIDLGVDSSTPANAAFSLIRTPGPGAVSSSGTNLFGVDPQLGPLASNGGPTQTEALPLTSPAVDKGNTSLNRDQRGIGRPADLTTVPNAAGGNGSDIGAFELPPTCKGKTATVFSTGSHKLTGTKRNDVIVGTDGKDKINGKAGNDVVCALGGKDKVKGGKGNDKLLGGKGRDTLIGGPGKDKLKGGPGKDVVKQ